jgi:hypothetical protein
MHLGHCWFAVSELPGCRPGMTPLAGNGYFRRLASEDDCDEEQRED